MNLIKKIILSKPIVNPNYHWGAGPPPLKVADLMPKLAVAPSPPPMYEVSGSAYTASPSPPRVLLCEAGYCDYRGVCRFCQGTFADRSDIRHALTRYTVETCYVPGTVPEFKGALLVEHGLRLPVPISIKRAIRIVDERDVVVHECWDGVMRIGRDYMTTPTRTLSGTILGYRSWALESSGKGKTWRLVSLSHDQVWPRGVLEADCLNGIVAQPHPPLYGPCYCGIYAHSVINPVLLDVMQRWDRGMPVAFGVIEAWGDTIVADQGWRTERARPVVLAIPKTLNHIPTERWAPGHVARQLADYYDVDCHVMDIEVESTSQMVRGLKLPVEIVDAYPAKFELPPEAPQTKEISS